VKGGVQHNRATIRGGLRVIDRRDKSFKRVWPENGRPIRRDPRFNDCAEPTSAETFSCSGLHLAHGKNGMHTLYAVNRTERDSIEIFEVKEEPAGLAFTWIGAILLPYPCVGNSVTVLPDGSVVVTAMYMSNDNWADKIKTKEDTGYVVRWRPSVGWSKVPGSEGCIPNGIVSSPDGSMLYINYSGTGTSIAKPIDGDKSTRKVIELGFMPDNVRWGDDGNLWIGGVRQIGNPYPKICKISLATLKPEFIEIPDQAEPFNHCSVAIKIESEIWLGAFSCTCVAVLPAQ